MQYRTSPELRVNTRATKVKLIYKVLQYCNNDETRNAVIDLSRVEMYFSITYICY